MKLYYKFVGGIVLYLLACVLWLAPNVANGFAIIMYHRVGEDSIPSTNVTKEQFLNHLNLIQELGFQVVPLDKVMADLAEGKAFPAKSLAITVDDAYRSFYANAWPELKKRRYSFTLFASTSAITAKGNQDYLSWAELNELKSSGLVNFGGHGHAHSHMADLSLEAAKEDIRLSQELMRQNLGLELRLFSYPFGEASLELAKLVEDAGYQFAFGQHSGSPALETDGKWFLPRFAFSQNYADRSRFITALQSEPMILKDITPAESVLSDNPPKMGFTLVEPQLGNTPRLNCYMGTGERTDLEILGQRVEVRFPKAFGKGRTRVNCTMPGPSAGVTLWYGRQFYLPWR